MTGASHKATIATSCDFMKNTLPWTELDPAKADYNATHGAYVEGCTLLELPPVKGFKNKFKPVICVGLCSCASRDEAEKMARRYSGPEEKDRRVSYKTLLSWVKTQTPIVQTI